MARYQVKVQISAVRLPDPQPEPVYDPGRDPIMNAMDKLGQIAQVAGPMIGGGPSYFRESGLTLSKEVTIGAESFEELAKALGQFDALAEQIECANPTKKW